MAVVGGGGSGGIDGGDEFVDMMSCRRQWQY